MSDQTQDHAAAVDAVVDAWLNHGPQPAYHRAAMAKLIRETLALFLDGAEAMPVLYGVFLYMGVTALNGVQMVDRVLLFIMPMKYQPDTEYLRRVRLAKVNLFTAIQVRS